MAAIKHLLALTLAALPANAAAQSEDPLCADLQHALATMTAPHSYTPGWQAPHYALLAGCTARRVGFGNELFCIWPRAAPDPSAEAPAARIQHCFPTARRLPSQEGVDGIRLGYDSYVLTVAQAGADAHIHVSIPEG